LGDFTFMKTALALQLDDFIENLDYASEGDRVEAMQAIRDRYCHECGTRHEGRKCQCWNDE
jgi:hypothetical protein